MPNMNSLICSTKETHEVQDTTYSSNSITSPLHKKRRRLNKISPGEVRKFKAEDEKERCNQIIQGFTMLKEQLPPTFYKMSNAELLKKVLKNKEVKNLNDKWLQLNSICTKLNSELEYFKK
ncbi:39147_t:CDS:2 [Gigaspora margarita]|uniref:39147_t:CDS:1 n=1 Tax=Gigaspora margarita TaxID=4874 RepID=A0ABN7UU18_GIGMA|nr:39147_t:CDS:2 [Gigaspora margarita]